MPAPGRSLRAIGCRIMVASERIIAAQIVVHQKLSMLRSDEIRSVMSSTTALMRIRSNPAVRKINGRVRMRMNVPMNALITPNRNDTQRYPATPPETVMPGSSQAVIAKATATAIQDTRNTLSMW